MVFFPAAIFIWFVGCHAMDDTDTGDILNTEESQEPVKIKLLPVTSRVMTTTNFLDLGLIYILFFFNYLHLRICLKEIQILTTLGRFLDHFTICPLSLQTNEDLPDPFIFQNFLNSSRTEFSLVIVHIIIIIWYDKIL